MCDKPIGAPEILYTGGSVKSLLSGLSGSLLKGLSTPVRGLLPGAWRLLLRLALRKSTP